MKKILFLLLLIPSISFTQNYNGYKIFVKEQFFYKEIVNIHQEINIWYNKKECYLNITSICLNYNFLTQCLSSNQFFAIDAENTNIKYYIVYSKKEVLIYFEDINNISYIILIQRNHDY